MTGKQDTAGTASSAVPGDVSEEQPTTDTNALPGSVEDRLARIEQHLNLQRFISHDDEEPQA